MIANTFKTLDTNTELLAVMERSAVIIDPEYDYQTTAYIFEDDSMLLWSSDNVVTVYVSSR